MHTIRHLLTCSFPLRQHHRAGDWRLAGQARFEAMAARYYRGASLDSVRIRRHRLVSICLVVFLLFSAVYLCLFVELTLYFICSLQCLRGRIDVAMATAAGDVHKRNGVFV